MTGQTRHHRIRPFGSRLVALVMLALVTVLVVWGLRAWLNPPAIVAGSDSGVSRIEPSFIPSGELDRLISVYEQRVTAATNASDHLILGALYMEKGRVTGDVSRYRAAEEAYRRATDIYPSDPAARLGSASASYALHRFSDARDRAALVLDATDRTDALTLVTDATLALGEYAEGGRLLDLLASREPAHPAVRVRQAEWYRLRGDRDRAWETTTGIVSAIREVPNPRLRAWYQGFAAQMAYDLGRYRQGLDWAERALTDDPRSVPARVARARLLAATGALEESHHQYEEITTTQPDPSFLIEQAAVLDALGADQAQQEVTDTLETLGNISSGQSVYDRSLALFYAEAGSDPARAVEIARGELESRDDVGAWDALAWALYSDGQYEEAEEAAQQALRLGTLDARFEFHAGMIALANDDMAEARAHLQKALDISPHFSPVNADRARRALEEIP